jgi:SAM-dependent methyltransferase
LQERAAELFCEKGHTYPIVEGIPVLLVEDADPTNPNVFDATRARVTSRRTAAGADAHAFVQSMMRRTCGYLYADLRKELPRYPIPEIRLPPGDGKTLLDVGCNWGRWTVAAGRKGYRVAGLDPNLDALIAARSVVAETGGGEASFVCGDARAMPFSDSTFDAVFSYSVLQHFDKEQARTAMREMARVARVDATVLVQMANKFGVRQMFNRGKQIVTRNASPFRVRYWAPRELRQSVQGLIGPCELSVDGFFSLNAQMTDRDMLPRRYAAVVTLSDALRRASDRVPFLLEAADSLYFQADNRKAFRSSGQP